MYTLGWLQDHPKLWNKYFLYLKKKKEFSINMCCWPISQKNKVLLTTLEKNKKIKNLTTQLEHFK